MFYAVPVKYKNRPATKINSLKFFEENIYISKDVVEKGYFVSNKGQGSGSNSRRGANPQLDSGLFPVSPVTPELIERCRKKEILRVSQVQSLLLFLG